MGKYVYLYFVKWTERGLEKLSSKDFMSETWMPKHVELCKEHDVELLTHGIPYGTVEETVFVYETDRALAEFGEFQMKIRSLDEEKLINYSKTTVVVRFP